jgi:hypothetical protein
MNQHNAAIAAGYSEKYAKQACRIERLVKVSLADEFERAGLTDKAIIVHALSGLNALKLQSCNVYISKPSAESIDADKLIINKNSNDFIETEDWTARHKYFDTILRLTNRLQDKPLIDQSLHNHFTYVWKDTNHRDRLFAPELSEGDSR